MGTTWAMGAEEIASECLYRIYSENSMTSLRRLKPGKIRPWHPWVMILIDSVSRAGNRCSM